MLALTAGVARSSSTPAPPTRARYIGGAARIQQARERDLDEANLDAVTTRWDRDDAPREHRATRRLAGCGRARRPAASACSGRSSCSSSVRPRRPRRAGRRLPPRRGGVRPASGDDPAPRHRRRQADPVHAAAGRGQPVPRRPRAAPRGDAAGPVRDSVARLLPGGDARPGQGDGADDRRRARRGDAPGRWRIGPGRRSRPRGCRSARSISA